MLNHCRAGAKVQPAELISTLKVPQSGDASTSQRYEAIAALAPEVVQLRAGVIQVFNDKLGQVIAFLDLMAPASSGRVGAKLKAIATSFTSC